PDLALDRDRRGQGVGSTDAAQAGAPRGRGPAPRHDRRPGPHPAARSRTSGGARMTTLTGPQTAAAPKAPHKTKEPRPDDVRRRRGGGLGIERRPGWLTYTLVAVFF